MYLARHFRSIARKSLRGFWALMIGVTLIAVLLGGGVDFSSGSTSVGRLTGNYQDSDEYSVYFEDSTFSISHHPEFTCDFPRTDCDRADRNSSGGDPAADRRRD